MLKTASGTAPKTTVRPNASQGSRRIWLSMLLGLALLVAGCGAGLADPQARAVVLGLLSVGIAMFVVSLVLLRGRRAAPPALDPTASAKADPAPAGLPAAKPAAALSADPVAVLLEGAVAEPPAGQDQRTPQALGAATSRPSSKPSEAAFDLAALIDAPLADLLLAALCKDPVGARLIFAKALESAAQPEASADALLPARAAAP